VIQAIGTIAVGFELLVDLVGKWSRRIVSIARLYIASSHTSKESKEYIVTLAAF
jgi:hypothetical protein